MRFFKLLLIISLTATTLCGARHGNGGATVNICYSGTGTCNTGANKFDFTPGFTLMSWVRSGHAPGTATTQDIISVGDTGGSNAIQGMNWDGTGSGGHNIKQGCFAINGSSTYVTIGITSPATLSANTWYHIACVWDGSNLIVYLNGINKGQTALVSLAHPGTSVYAGFQWSLNGCGAAGCNGSGIDMFTGDIAEQVVYTIPLTPNEIKMAAAGRPAPTFRRPPNTTLSDAGALYLPLWGLSSPENSLAGQLSNLFANRFGFGYVFDGGMTVVNHAPVTPYIQESEAAW